MSLVIFIAILAVLILVHELGHFGVAKLFNIKVEEFGIGFPPRLLYVRKGETIYSINLLFFGGFVKIFGENGSETAKEPRSFAGKSRWAQAAVVVAGIVMNILFAWAILSAGYMVGLPASAEESDYGYMADQKVTIVGVLPGSPAAKAGLEAGDVVTAVETGSAKLVVATLSTNRQADVVRNFIADHGDESAVLTVVRGGEEKFFVAQPVDGLIEGKKAIGVQLDDIGTLKLAPLQATVEGAKRTWDITSSTAVGLLSFFSQVFRGAADFSSVAGPIGIASIGSHAVTEGFAAALTLTALISINLALINVLPIPGLDGGRLLLIAIEGVIRRPVSPKISAAIMVVGFGALILLMVVVSYHDIARLIG
jgi:regulator of sigma E protease